MINEKLEPYYSDSSVTLYNGDAKDLIELLEDDSINAIITDPPYGLEEFSKSRGHGRKRLNRANHVDDGWDKIEDSSIVVNNIINESPRILEKGGNLLMFCSFEQSGEFVKTAPKELYYKTIGIWHKLNPIPINMKIRYVNSTEQWIHWVNGKKTGTFNGYGKPVHNFIETGLTPASEKKYGKHSTQKPLSVMNWFVETLTNPGDVILDPFSGSGSTLVSAKQLGRKAIGFEMNPEYCEIIANRLKNTDYK